jgi:beta-glucosidase
MNRRQFTRISATLAAGFMCPPALLRAQGPRSAALTSHDRDVQALLGKMTLEEKIGQMVQAEHSAVKDIGDVDRYFLGSVLAGGNADPKSGNGLVDWTDMYDAVQSRALKTRLAIPLLFGVDAVHGHNNVIGAVVFPHNIGLGCTRNPKLIEAAARATAEEIRATGINWNFAPCVAVPRDKRWGRTYEGFGESPELVTELGIAAVRGFQGSKLSDPRSVVACAKHFAGDGGTEFGTGGVPKQGGGRHPLDQGDTKLSEADLRKLHMQGYIGAIGAGVATIMPSYNSWNGQKVSGSKRLLTEILKQEMKFDGFLISDYNAVDQLPGDYKAQIAQATNAGMDMFMVPEKYRELYGHLLDLAKSGGIPMSRIDDAVTRILRVKFAAGLMDRARSPLADRSLHKTFGSPAHRQVARDCVRQSLVLLKNANKALPVSKSVARIHVAGKMADDIGSQCGGWTIEWQGKSGNITTGGTTILKAIQGAVSATTKVTTSADGTGADGANIGIAVIGEPPYAEFFGDRENLELPGDDVAVVENMKKAGIPVIVLLLSGRPLIIEKVLANCDAFVAAWLPGTEGQGVADVIFGDHKPTGKLSVSWPRSSSKTPVNVGDASYDPLFKYGEGLSY